MMTSPSVSVNRRLSMMAMIQATAALLTGRRAPAVVGPAAMTHYAPHARRNRSRWGNATQKKRQGAKVKALRKLQRRSRRRNRAA